MLLPQHIAEMCQTRFLCGVSPIFVGLHGIDDTNDGRSYHDTGHVSYGRWHSSDKTTTVVLPKVPTVYTVIHELGHVFDEQTHFLLDVPKTTAYSDMTRMERVAEAFSLLLVPDFAWCGLWRDYIAAERFRPFRELVLG